MDGPNVNNSEQVKQNQKGKSISRASQLSNKLFDSCMPQQFQERSFEVWFQGRGIVHESVLLLQQNIMQASRSV